MDYIFDITLQVFIQILFIRTAAELSIAHSEFAMIFLPLTAGNQFQRLRCSSQPHCTVESTFCAFRKKMTYSFGTNSTTATRITESRKADMRATQPPM